MDERRFCCGCGLCSSDGIPPLSQSFSRLGIVRTAFGSAFGLTKTFVIGFYSVIFRMTAETGFIFKVDNPFFEVYFAPSPVP